MNNELLQTLPSFDSMCYSNKENLVPCVSKPNSVDESSNIFNPPPQPPVYYCEFHGSDAQYGHYCTPQALFNNHEPGYSQDFNFPQNIYEFQQHIHSNQPLNIQNELNNHELFINELIQQKLQKENENAQLFSAIVITLDLPTVEPKDSLRMGDEHLDIIPKKESGEFIKSSVENLVPSPSESEDECECDVPPCDDFTTFSNLLFDADDDFSSSDDKSFSDKGIPKEIYSNHLFEEEIISIKIHPHHFNAEELILIKSIPPGIDEADYDPEEEILCIEKLLYDNSSPRPPKEFISKNYDAAIESFSPSPILVEDSDSLRDEIDLSLTPDELMPPGIEDDDYDSEGDILILEELLNDDEIEPNSGILTIKVVGDISEHYVPMPRLLPTQPTLASNQEKSPHLLSHRGLKAFQLPSKNPMMIYGGNISILDVPFLHFYPP
nr:hypothetical protein [Tanacetum cinerariifolium]